MSIQAEYKAKLNWQVKSWIKTERIPHPCGLSVFSTSFLCALPSPPTVKRPYCINPNPLTNKTPLHERVSRDGKRNQQNKYWKDGKTGKSSPHTQVKQHWVECLLCTSFTIKVILHCLKPHPDSEAGRSRVCLTLYMPLRNKWLTLPLYGWRAQGYHFHACYSHKSAKNQSPFNC